MSTMSCLGASRAAPSRNVMASMKAALETV